MGKKCRVAHYPDHHLYVFNGFGPLQETAGSSQLLVRFRSFILDQRFPFSLNFKGFKLDDKFPTLKDMSITMETFQYR